MDYEVQTTTFVHSDLTVPSVEFNVAPRPLDPPLNFVSFLVPRISEDLTHVSHLSLDATLAQGCARSQRFYTCNIPGCPNVYRRACDLRYGVHFRHFRMTVQYLTLLTQSLHETGSMRETIPGQLHA
jgi:hypothetical protein